MNLLLGSGGLSTPERQKAWADACQLFLSGISEVVYIPYAVKDEQKSLSVTQSFGWLGECSAKGIFEFEDPIKAVDQAEAIYITGGNTFRLLHRLQSEGLLDVIRSRAHEGMPYIGISAGSNVAGPSIKTTNDMPIVEPESFEALNLVPFQINPHYTPSKTYYYSGEELLPYGGESRGDRLREFHEMNETPLLAMSEGASLKVKNEELLLGGEGYGLILRPGEAPKRCEAGESLDQKLLGL